MNVKEFIYYKSKVFKELKAKELEEFKTLISNAKISSDGAIQWNTPGSYKYCDNISEIIQALDEDWKDLIIESPEYNLFSKTEQEEILKTTQPVYVSDIIEKTKQVEYDTPTVYCDVCGKEIKNFKKYLTVFAYDEDGVCYEKKDILDLCDECAQLEKRLFLNTIDFPDKYDDISEEDKQELIDKLKKIKVEVENEKTYQKQILQKLKEDV